MCVIIWGCIKNPTLSVYAYLLEEQSCQISPRFNSKRRSLGLFLKKVLLWFFGKYPAMGVTLYRWSAMA